MSFLAPLGLALFSLAAVVALLYILKVRRRRVAVPYLRLWETLVVETRSRSLFKRLQRWLSLLLQLAILAMLVLAVADPTFRADREQVEQLIVVLDASASMNAVDDPDSGRTRFAAMVERARELIARRSSEDSMMLIAASDRIEVLSPLDKSRIKLGKALERLRPSQRALAPDLVVEFLAQTAGRLERPRVLVLGDGGAASIPGRLGLGERAAWLPIGESSDNIAITRFGARRNESLGTDFVIAEIRNLGAEERQVDLELLLDGDRQKVLPLALAPGETRLERLELALPEGGTLELRIETGDALAVDDRAYAIIPPHRARRVVLVTETVEAAEPFGIAFDSMEGAIDPSSAAFTREEFAALPAAERAADITICLGTLPEGIDPRSHRILIGTPLPPGFPAEETGTVERPRVWDWDRDHLLNRWLNYRDLPLPPARRFAAGTGAEPIVEGYEGPLIVAADEGTRRTIVVAFDMTAELFPFRLAFPLLLRNAIAWFETSEDSVLEPAYATGAVISPLRRVPSAVVEAAYFVGAEPRTESLPTVEGKFYFAATDEPGPVRFAWGDEAHATAVNLLDPAESDLTVPEEPAATAEDLLGPRGRFSSELWATLAALGLILWSLEWWLYHRRITE